jgi:hypothetical protein
MSFADESVCLMADYVWKDGTSLTYGPLDGIMFHG